MVLNHVFSKNMETELGKLGMEVVYHRLSNFENYLFEIIDSLSDGIVDLEKSRKLSSKNFKLIVLQEGTIFVTKNNYRLYKLKCYNGEVFISKTIILNDKVDRESMMDELMAEYVIGSGEVHYFQIPDTSDIRLNNYFVLLQSKRKNRAPYETKMMEADKIDKNCRCIPECSVNDIMESYMELISSLGF